MCIRDRSSLAGGPLLSPRFQYSFAIKVDGSDDNITLGVQDCTKKVDRNLIKQQ